MTIALIDYGIGNLRSVKKAFETVGAEVIQTDKAQEILSAQKVILPGVGAFQDGMLGLKDRDLIATLQEIVNRNTPLMGICLGMQLLFEVSSEMGQCEGLGFIKGEVRKFYNNGIKIPQTGWNQLIIKNNSDLFAGINDNAYVYFNHSYYCAPTRPENIISQTEYALCYASAIQLGSIYGVQFHPEKSQTVGLTILKNFVEVCQ